jgi:hypothetical protein
MFVTSQILLYSCAMRSNESCFVRSETLLRGAAPALVAAALLLATSTVLARVY